MQCITYMRLQKAVPPPYKQGIALVSTTHAASQEAVACRSDEDYTAVPNSQYRFLVKYFGGGPPIPRIVEKRFDQLVIATHALKLHVAIIADGEIVSESPRRTLFVSSSMRVADLKAEVAKALGVSAAVCEHTLWDFQGQRKLQNMDKGRTGLDEPTLADMNIQGPDGQTMTVQNDQMVVLEKGAPDDNVALMDFTATSSSTITPFFQRPFRPVPAVDFTADTASSDPDAAPGVAGLSNLGNTCFMNSSLQCLMHTVPMMRCFLTDAYKSDINVNNPLGKGGEVAHAFGSLMQQIWKGGVSSVAPRGFKRILGKHASQFQGYEQHDSQELLSYLLDMLHEDINRIKQKPYIEEKDDPQAGDDTVAREAWAMYKARNDSGIVDHFQGLLKSTLDCPACGHHKRKFDPFMYLSLPLPGSDTVVRELIFVKVGGPDPPIMCAVRVKKGCSVAAFCAAVAETLQLELSDNTPPEHVMTVATFNWRLAVHEDPLMELPMRYATDKTIVYFYSSVKAGPRNGGKKTLIWPPSGSSVPLLLWVKPGIVSREHLEEEPASSSSGSRLVLSTECLLQDQVDDALRPFKRRKGLDGADGAEEAPIRAANCPPAPPLPERPRSRSYGGDAPSEGSSGARLAFSSPGDEILPNGQRKISLVSPIDFGNWPSANLEEQMSASMEESEGDAAPSTGMAVGTPADGFRALGFPVASVANGGQGVVTGVPAGDRAVESGETWTLIESSADDSGSSKPGTQHGGNAFDGAEAARSSPEPYSAYNGHVNEVAILLGGDSEPAVTDTRVHGGMGGVPRAKPLDLWGTQAPVGPQLADEQRMAQHPEPPFRLVVANDTGTPITNPSHLRLSEPSETSEAHCFKLEVDKSADVNSLFDLKSMTNPAKHESCAELHRSRQCTLEQCIQTYLASEVLSPNDAWYCPSCKTDVQARKALALWRLPEILVVHLKRFSYSGSGYLSTISHKLDSVVQFPLQGLDLTQYVHEQQGERSVYDCFAVSNHFGSASGGHYTAFCCVPKAGDSPGAPPEQDWHLFDDSSVTSVSPDKVVSAAAYVLFYRRRDESSKDPPNLLEHFRKGLQARQAEAACETQQPTTTAAPEDVAPGRPPSTPSPSSMDTELPEAPSPRGVQDTWDGIAAPESASACSDTISHSGASFLTDPVAQTNDKAGAISSWLQGIEGPEIEGATDNPEEFAASSPRGP